MCLLHKLIVFLILPPADKPKACERTGSHCIDVDGSGPLAPFDVECEEDDGEF